MRALACTLSGLIAMSAAAAGEAAPDAPAASEQKAAAAGRGELSPKQALLARDTLAHVMTGEFALQGGDAARAFEEFMLAARKSRQADIAGRAFAAAEAGQNEEAARQAFALWKELDPDNSRVRLMRAGELFSKGQFEEGARTVESLLKETDEPATLLESIVQLSAATPEKARLYDTLNALFEKNNEDARVELVLASLAAQAKMREAARDHGLKAIALAPDNPHILLQGADYEYALDPGAASRRLADYLKDHPGSVQVRLSYAKSLLKTGEIDKLQRELSRIETDRKDEPRAIFVLGMFAEEAQLFEKAKLYYKKYLVLLAKDPDTKLLPDSAYVRLGMVELAQGRAEQAVEWLDKVEKGDKYQAARLKEVEILAGLQRVDDACRILRTMRVSSSAQKSTLLRTCAGLLLNAGRKGEVIDVLQEAIKAAPGDAELIYQTAMTAHEVGRLEESEALLRSFIKLAPDNPNGYNSLGYMWLERGIRLKEAGELIEKAMGLTDGRNPYVTDSLGWLRFKQGRLDEAEKLLARARTIEPGDHEIGLHLAQVLHALGKTPRALDVLNEVLKADPENARARQLRQSYLGESGSSGARQ